MQVQNHSYGNVFRQHFHFYASQTYCHMKGIAHFDTAAQGNSEMSYLFSVVVGISFWPVSKGGIPGIVFTS